MGLSGPLFLFALFVCVCVCVVCVVACSPHLCAGFLLLPLVVRAPRLLLLLLLPPSLLITVSLTLTHAHSHSLTHTHSLTLTHTHSLTLTHSHSLTHTHSRSLTHTQSLTLTHTHSLTLTHTHSLTHSRSLTLTHSHPLSFTHSHSLTHSLTRSLTHSHSLTHGSCLEGQDVGARARRGVCEIVAGAALWRCRCRSRGRRSILCIWVCVCVAGVAFRSCLKGQDVVARAAGGVRNRGRRSTLAMPLPKSWQAQHSVHLGVCLCGRGSIPQLSRGTGCWRARGGGCAKSWQAQHFGDAVAEVVAGAAFCASGCVFVWQG